MDSPDQRTEQILREIMAAEGGPEQYGKNHEQYKLDRRMLSRLLPELARKGRRRWVAVFKEKVRWEKQD
ncbi:MAG: hypothetical protein A2126_04860 [Candidatus Woykebacteria bacterium GWB1_45_5]|uniref:HTH OST-type domain-containing protein n=1 Tax=Candidatus Woykebacteria bacterium GWB1_45_5 TaxID=1802592 RepID=A0A1G1W4X2_9BACT|nr:MAG: hypothetical protein A2126_04860 [Candidatus Woykebacteria bacterium GWB1_45_5]